MNKASAENAGKICVIGERSISLGFRLIGVMDTVEATGEEGLQRLAEAEKSGKYSVIFVSDSLKRSMDTRLLTYYETVLNPLIMFIPLPGEESEESLAAMAKRILGVDIGK